MHISKSTHDHFVWNAYIKRRIDEKQNEHSGFYDQKIYKEAINIAEH